MMMGHTFYTEMAAVDVKKRKHGSASEDEEVSPPPVKKQAVQSLDVGKYCFTNGLRCVKPYYFMFKTHAKGRWVGRKVLDVFSEEFQSETKEYYERAIRVGNVKVNGKSATMETVVRDNDVVTHLVHRHEPPVTAHTINIIHNDKHLLIVNKPSSIPVHPCGRYRHNTVIFILKNEFNINNIYTLHRLDRLTSGLLLFGKTISKVQDIEEEIRERKVKKEYLALVNGEFNNKGNVEEIMMRKITLIAPVECSESIKVMSHKIGVCCVDPVDGKPCSTVFTLISYNKDKDISLLKCEPRTGRMHQIRVHLQHLGFPVINDPLYSHSSWSRHKRSDTELILSDIISSRFPQVKEESIKTKDDSIKTELQEEEAAEGAFDIDPNCTECHTHHPDPTPNELIMYLHALRYSGDGWDFKTDPPEWAQDYLKDKCLD